MSILQTIDLKKYYGTEPNITRALNGVNFTVEQGEFVAVVGTSGSGKSTLLHMMGGLDTPTSGSVIVRGEELAKKNDDELTIFRRRNIGFIFQNYNLVPILNVYENIVLPVELDGDTVDQKFMDEVVYMLALEDKLDFLFQALVKTSRLETGAIRLEKKDSSLFHTLAQAMSSIVYAAEKKEIAVSVDCPENLIISHDSKWTSEALFNLLDNAVKYTPSGGKISVSVVQWEMYVEVKVTDTGKGISESNQAAIFRRFYREEEVHDQQGVGIGLYLAREIVTRQGGYIKVVSELRQGSEFSIMLPVR